MSKKDGESDKFVYADDLDDNFFDSFDKGYEVIDAVGKTDATNFGSASAKTERTESGEGNSSKSSKREEKPRGSRDTRSSREAERAKRSRSPDRNRPDPRPKPGPWAKNPRISPPPPRRISPRRKSPVNGRNIGRPSNRPSFLEEMAQKFPGMMEENSGNHVNNANFRPPMNPGPWTHQGQVMMQQAAPMPVMQGAPMPIMQGHFMAPQQLMPLMPGPNFGMPYPNPNIPQGMPMEPAYHHPGFQLNAFSNPMNPMTQPNIPQMPMPVPAPEILPQATKVLQPQKSTEKVNERSKDSEIQEAKKKAFGESKLSLTDILRQITADQSKQKQEDSEENKREKVKERCKKAVKVLEELEANVKPTQLYFCAARNVDIIKIRNDPHPKLVGRSPLVINESNVLFPCQASSEENFRIAMLGSPLRNISGKLSTVARHLNMNLNEVSEKIGSRKGVKRRTAAPADISHISIEVAMRKASQSTQTDKNPCDKCDKDAKKIFESVSVQANMQIGNNQAPPVEEPGSFNVNLNVDRVKSMTRNQHQILTEFCQAFSLYPDTYGAINEPTDWNDENNYDEHDKMPFANPANPRHPDFIAFSPLRERSPSPRSYRSPSFDDHPSRSSRRLEELSPPQNFMNRSPPSRYNKSPTRYSNRSPPPLMQDHQQRRRITERLGEKISSPLSDHENFAGTSRGSAYERERPSRPYIIPSPPPMRYSDDAYSRGEASHSSREMRFRDRSDSRSPIRHQDGASYRGRRGRY